MTTQRQIEANRRNAALSTGPKTEAGRASSRRNALNHGMTGEGVVRTEEETSKGAVRLEEWRALYRPADAKQEWLVEQAAYLSVRLSRCWTHDWALRMLAAERAEGRWDEDRRLAAEELGARLGAQPALTGHRLRRTRQGCAWLIERWEGLAALLGDGRDWTEAQRTLALDLLGTPAELRDGPNRLDPAGSSGEDLRSARRAVAEAEIAALRHLHDETMVGLDESERMATAMGFSPEIEHSVRLMMRYEAANARRMHWALAQLDRLKTHAEPAALAPPTAPRLCIAEQSPDLPAVIDSLDDLNHQPNPAGEPEPAELSPAPAPEPAIVELETAPATESLPPMLTAVPSIAPRAPGGLAANVLGRARSASAGNRRARRAQKSRDRRN